MTNYVDGPSLLQARDTHNHHRFHSVANERSLNDHHLERTDHTERDETHILSPPAHQLQARQIVVVETVSVVHFIDDTGAVVQHATLLPDAVPTLLNPAAVATAGVAAVDDLLDDLVDGVLPTPAVDTPGTPTPSASESVLSGTDSLTTAPSTSTGFPILSTGISNSTHYGNSTGLFLNTTRTSTKFKSSSSRTLLTSFSNVPTETAGGAGGNVGANGVPAGVPAAPTTVPPAAPTNSSGLTPAAQSAVIGGVVGSVAGIALVALFLMFILKWKRGHRSGLLLLPDGDEKGGHRGLFPGSKPPGGGGGDKGGVWDGQQGAPFAVPSALAALTGPRTRAIEEGPKPTPSTEKGFYRVSGKRLRPVLESGGDGYSDPEPDPRHSTMSGVSDYRHSEAFIGGSMERLQLGSPMRPVSGVPIFRSGPNRTPVEATGPFSDYFQRPDTPPTPMESHGPGRSLTPASAQQVPRGSPSRFAERT